MTSDELMKTLQFQELVSLVQIELERRQQYAPNRKHELEQELQAHTKHANGWLVSLSDPNLSSSVRAAIQERLDAALEKQQSLRLQIGELEVQEATIASLVDPAAILTSLSRLNEVLTADNPTLTNVELSLHIDKIACHPKGRVVLRTCRLGSLSRAVDFFSETPATPERDAEPHSENYQVTPRRRRRRRYFGVDPDDSGSSAALADFAADPERYSDLAPHWFDEFEFHVPEITFPAKELAMAVAAERKKGLTEAQLAAMFNVSNPTIRKALRIAKQSDPELAAMPWRVQNKRRWHEEHADQVAAAKAAGMSMAEMVTHFEKSDTTIRKALQNAGVHLPKPRKQPENAI
ncbi:hypothetical protein [Planctomicrobium sp. SH527]|uniref:hypothetical protein n=1 Tax=Planctomicrobium sp. SH527 TaxID=3448123 RepID=UPI003F5BA99C